MGSAGVSLAAHTIHWTGNETLPFEAVWFCYLFHDSDSVLWKLQYTAAHACIAACTAPSSAICSLQKPSSAASCLAAAQTAATAAGSDRWPCFRMDSSSRATPVVPGSYCCERLCTKGRLEKNDEVTVTTVTPCTALQDWLTSCVHKPSTS